MSKGMSSSSPELQIQEKCLCSGQNEVLLNPLSTEDKATTAQLSQLDA